MYTKDKELITKISTVFRYFENYDIHNSLLFRKLQRLPIQGELIVTSQRYDLLATEVYNNPEYSWFLYYYNGINEEDLVLGSKIKYPSIDSIRNLIQSLDEYVKY